jgi:predicted permease
MTPPLHRAIVRACGWLIPARYRRDVIDDLLDECAASVRPRRGSLYAAGWLLSHILRSAAATRRYRPSDTADAGRRDLPPLWDEVAADWRLARRSLTRSPLFTGVALLTLTAAIGLSTAVFSLVSSVLLRPLPYPQADRLVRLAQFSGDPSARIPTTGGTLAGVTIGQWLEETKALETLVPVSTNDRTVGIAGQSEQITVASVGRRFFDLLGATSQKGRLLNEQDHRREAPPVAVVSRRFVTQLLGGEDEAVGGVLTLEGVPHTIVGVVSSAMTVPAPDVDIWVPGRWVWPAPSVGAGPSGSRGGFSVSMTVIARMRPSARLDDVRVEGERVLRAIAMTDPAFFDGTVEVPQLRAVRLQDDVVAGARPALRALFAGMALVLIAACASLANLLVARNTARERDMVIRTTLGATRRRLLRPLLFEPLALVGAGAGLGGLLGWWILRGLPAIAPQGMPRLADVRFDGVSLAAASAVALVTGLLVGLRPGWRRRDAHLRDVSGSQRLGTRRGSRSAEVFRGALVAAQVALAVVLLVGASLIGQSLWRLMHTSPGYRPEGVLTFQVRLTSEARMQRGRLTQFYGELQERLRRVPGVVATGVASKLPLHAGAMSGTVIVEGAPGPGDGAERPQVGLYFVSADYLRALGTRLLAGRAFEDRDFETGARVALIDESLARSQFGGETVGKRVRAMGPRPWTVIGVVETVKFGAVSAADQPIMYFPATREFEGLALNRLGGGVIVRTAEDPASLVPLARQFVRELDPAAPMYNVMPLAERLDRTFDQPRFYTVALVLFALMTLATAILGVYGVQAYAVERRTAEFGVRRALGAGEGHIVRLVLGRAFWLAAAGTVIGVPLAATGVGLLRTMLFGVQPLDPSTFVAVPIVVLLVVLGASWQPARRALRVDPASALRYE